MIDPWRAGAAKYYGKNREDITLDERMLFKTLYFNMRGMLSADSEEEAVRKTEELGATLAPTRPKD